MNFPLWAFMLLPFGFGASCHLDRLIGQIDAQRQRALHDRPFLELETAQPVDEERIGLGNGARLLDVVPATRSDRGRSAVPSPSASGPEANTTPRFSRPIIYSRWAGRNGFNFSGATKALTAARRAFCAASFASVRRCAGPSHYSCPQLPVMVGRPGGTSHLSAGIVPVGRVGD